MVAETTQIHPGAGAFTEKGGDGGAISVDERVMRLEVEFEHVRKDLDEIKSDQKAILGRLGELPTRGNLWTMVGTVGAIALATIGIFVGVLTYLQSLAAVIK